MANSEAISGVHSYVLYGEETTYNTPVAVTTHFGYVTSFKANVNSNLNAHRGFVGSTSGGRDVLAFTPGQLDIGFSTEFKVQGWAFLEYVLGTVGGTYTYTGGIIPPSLTVATNIDNPGTAATDQEAAYSGCVIESATIRTSTGNPVTASLDFKAAKVIIDTTVTANAALSTKGVYNFVSGNIEVPAASALSNIIDSVEITVRNNWEVLYGVGSRLAQSALPKAREYTIRCTLKYLDNTLYTAALGATTPTATGTPTENATIELNFGNGSDTMVMTFTGVPMSEFAQMHELNDPIGEDLTFTAKSLSAVETIA